MNKEQLTETLEQMMDALDNMIDGLRSFAEEVNDEPEAEELEAPEYDYAVGDILDFANVRDGNMEFLTGTVADIDLHDDEGWYGRVVTREGRKFRVPYNLTDTRLGTRIMRIHTEH